MTEERVPIDPDGPFLQMATICERVLQEKDGILSLIRVIDRFQITQVGPSAPELMAPTRFPFTLVAMFKSGKARGSSTVSIQPESPSGLKMQGWQLPILLEGEDRGANLVLQVEFEVDQPGLYWFELRLDDQFVTRIPLRIVYQRVMAGPLGNPNG